MKTIITAIAIAFATITTANADEIDYEARLKELLDPTKKEEWIEANLKRAEAKRLAEVFIRQAVLNQLQAKSNFHEAEAFHFLAKIALLNAEAKRIEADIHAADMTWKEFNEEFPRVMINIKNAREKYDYHESEAKRFEAEAEAVRLKAIHNRESNIATIMQLLEESRAEAKLFIENINEDMDTMTGDSALTPSSNQQ